MPNQSDSRKKSKNFHAKTQRRRDFAKNVTAYSLRLCVFACAFLFGCGLSALRRSRLEMFAIELGCMGLLPLLMLFLTSCIEGNTVTLNGNKNEMVHEGGNGNIEDQTKKGHLTTNDYVRDLVSHPAFKEFGELLLPWGDNTFHYNTPLHQVGTLMPYHSQVKPDIIVGALNHMINEVNAGKTIFYNFYTAGQKQEDPAKNFTGLFFYRGKPGAPFAIVCPGGGFSYVASLHEGFPLAWEISKKGLNAFVIRYRVSEQKATADLAAAIAYIFSNADTLAVSTQGYSLWGASAGARMVGNIALSGVPRYGGGNLPKPAAVVIAYTGQSSYSSNFPPAFITVSANDWIANVSTVERRVENLRNAGVEVEYRRYRNAGHGFGLGVGTDAEGWMEDAIKFWESHLTK